MDHHYILKPKVLLLKREKKSRRRRQIFYETMTRDEKGTSYDGEEHIKIMEPIFEDMAKNIMKGFKFLAIQIWRKYIDLKKTKGKNASVCLKEQKEEIHEPPSFEIGEVEELVKEEDQNSLPSDSEEYEETSHEYEEVSIENTEDHFKTHSTLEMKQEHLLMDA